MKVRNVVVRAVVVTLLSGVASVSAQESSGVAGLAEVVVTARKRVELIQDAPLTIQAFTDKQIEERGVESIADLSKFAPGLTFTQGSSRAASDFSIRGMTQISPVGDNRKDLVTVFIDNVPYIGNPSAIGSEDLARVEVIKGPQSALFGKATFGGAISLITATPGNEVKGRVSATVGSYGDHRRQAGGPHRCRPQRVRRLLQERFRRPPWRDRAALYLGHAELHADRGSVDSPAVQRPA